MIESTQGQVKGKYLSISMIWEELTAALEKASSGCCPGGKCGPGGCRPTR